LVLVGQRRTRRNVARRIRKFVDVYDPDVDGLGLARDSLTIHV
jgi:hypothetical protein